MAVFPSGFDSFPTLVDNIDDITAAEPNNRGSAIVAIENKVGLNNSGVTSSLDYLIKNASSINPGHKHPESKITFNTTGGHTHDESNSTLISKITTNFQDLVTNNLTVGVKVQCGWNFANPDATGYGTKAIIFPEAFSAVPYYIDIFTFGNKTITDPTSRTDCTYGQHVDYSPGIIVLSVSGMTVKVKGGQGVRQLFYWKTIGPVA